MLANRWRLGAVGVAVAVLAVKLGAADVVVPPTAKPSPLADAVQRGDSHAVQALLKKKADVNATQADGATALHWAAYRGDAESAAALIRAKRQCQCEEQLRRHAARPCRAAGNAAVLDLLLKAGANPNDPVNL